MAALVPPQPAAFSAAVARLVDLLVREYEPRKIVLFGSVARGEAGESSDIDLLIIKDTTATPEQRWMEVGALALRLGLRIPVEPVVLTPEELLEQKARRHPMIQDILRHGRVIHDDGRDPVNGYLLTRPTAAKPHAVVPAARAAAPSGWASPAPGKIASGSAWPRSR
ncbi:MAG: nucleotidyltransferase domain-containing protein [Deltaproteobacteria bacterium]|nr:nucleotidyltransferase domain-containing protein [Deltaproteobacteria bacterium]